MKDAIHPAYIIGPAFKVLNARTHQLIESHHTLEQAQAVADQLHRDMPGHDHFIIYQVKWCGGSKRLSDIKRSTDTEQAKRAIGYLLGD